jgi:hypothetical protein
MKFQTPESKYYNTKTAKTGDVITFKNEFKQEQTKFGPKIVGNIEVGGKEKIFQLKPNSRAHRALAVKFGEDSVEWIGQKANVFIDDSGQFPQIILSPITKEIDVESPF